MEGSKRGSTIWLLKSSSTYRCEMITPLRRPQVDTLKSRYAVESRVLFAIAAIYETASKVIKITK